MTEHHNGTKRVTIRMWGAQPGRQVATIKPHWPNERARCVDLDGTLESRLRELLATATNPNNRKGKQ